MVQGWAQRIGAAAAAAVLAAVGLVTVPGAAQAAEAPDAFRIHGSGYGHGVGMSQYGAYEMAREGHRGVAILKHYYTGARAPWVRTPKNVSVQVYGPDPYSYTGYGDTEDATTVRVHDGSWRLRTKQGDTIARGSGDTRLRVTTSGDKVRVRVDGTTYVRKVLRLHWSGTRHYQRDRRAALVTVDGAHGTYRHGRLTLTPRSGIPNVVNDLRLNTKYLYGLAEMPSSWGLNGGAKALRAQAMAARSYALVKSERRTRACGCHVVDDVRDQNFTGWKKEAEGVDGRFGKVWRAAVNASVDTSTRARALSYDGTPVEGHYFSSSGGRTADSEDVWTSYVPYERSVADPYSKRAPGNSYASWTRTITQKKAAALFGLDEVASIEVTSRWTSGQARTLTATSPSGKERSVTGKADEIRHTVGDATRAGSMPASWVARITAR